MKKTNELNLKKKTERKIFCSLSVVICLGKFFRKILIYVTQGSKLIVIFITKQQQQNINLKKKKQ